MCVRACVFQIYLNAADYFFLLCIKSLLFISLVIIFCHVKSFHTSFLLFFDITPTTVMSNINKEQESSSSGHGSSLNDNPASPIHVDVGPLAPINQVAHVSNANNEGNNNNIITNNNNIVVDTTNNNNNVSVVDPIVIDRDRRLSISINDELVDALAGLQTTPVVLSASQRRHARRRKMVARFKEAAGLGSSMVQGSGRGGPGFSGGSSWGDRGGWQRGGGPEKGGRGQIGVGGMGRGWQGPVAVAGGTPKRPLQSPDTPPSARHQPKRLLSNFEGQGPLEPPVDQHRVVVTYAGDHSVGINVADFNAFLSTLNALMIQSRGLGKVYRVTGTQFSKGRIFVDCQDPDTESWVLETCAQIRRGDRTFRGWKHSEVPVLIEVKLTPYSAWVPGGHLLSAASVIGSLRGDNPGLQTRLWRPLYSNPPIPLNRAGLIQGQTFVFRFDEGTVEFIKARDGMLSLGLIKVHFTEVVLRRGGGGDRCGEGDKAG
jgi:hypothetical protein